jgi:cobalt-zinc-cadmium efflux system outer membrane protein
LDEVAALAMMRSIRSVAALVATALLGLWAPEARAQQPALGAPPPALGDEQAVVRFALSHNPDLRAAQWSEAIARAGVQSASALSNPVARGEWLHVQSGSDYGWGVGLEWQPPQPGVYGSRKEAAQAGVRAAQADFRERAADLEADVRRSYAQIQALGEEIALAEKSLEIRRALEKAVQERVNHGAANRIDLSLTTVSRARGEQERDLLVMARHTELAQLEALVGLPATQALDVPPTTAVTEATRAPSAAEPTSNANLEQRAVAARPMLRADAARADAAESALAAEQAKRYPWLELQARYRRHDQATYPEDVTLGVAVTLPLFSQNAGPIAAAEASQRQQQALALAHRMGIVRDVRVLRRESEQRKLIAEHYAEAIAPVLREHAALVKQALAGLELDVTTLLAAEDMVTRGSIDYLEARLAQRRADISLSRALGEYGQVPSAGSK